MVSMGSLIWLPSMAKWLAFRALTVHPNSIQPTGLCWCRTGRPRCGDSRGSRDFWAIDPDRNLRGFWLQSSPYQAIETKNIIKYSN